MTEDKKTTATSHAAAQNSVENKADSKPEKGHESADNDVAGKSPVPESVHERDSALENASSGTPAAASAAVEGSPAASPAAVSQATAAGAPASKTTESGATTENPATESRAVASAVTPPGPGQATPAVDTRAVDSQNPAEGARAESSKAERAPEATPPSEPAVNESGLAPAAQKPARAADTAVKARAGSEQPESDASSARAPEPDDADVEAEAEAEAASMAAVPAQTTRVRFADLNLDKRLHKAIEAIGFEFCTPIQAETLPYTLACHDLIGQAQTGTGKTAAFLITAIQTMLETPIPDQERFASEPRVLALAPTRELAMQIAKDAEELCRHTGHRVVSVVGGMNYDKQRDQLQNEVVDILVATPGRLIDFLGSQDVFLDQLDLLILDEADRMLDMGFIPDVKRIIRRCTPKENRQTLLFSATFNQDVLNLASMWTQGAEFIEIEPQQKTAERVKQTVYLVSDDDKLTVLVNCLRDAAVEKAIVFANRRDQCRDLDEDLRNQGVKVALMSGEIAQNKRLKTLDQFKRGDIQVLVATDVAGRGIHVEGVTHVFNYNLPENAEDYVHRIGRTGRAGQHGISISFAGEDDAFALPAIESYISQKLTTAIPEEDLMMPLDKPRIQRRRGRRPQGGGQGGGRGRPRPRRN